MSVSTSKAGANSPTPIQPLPTVKHSGPASEVDVGQGRLSVIWRRVRYVARFIYWTVKHRSTANAGWVCNYEGFHW